MKRFFTRRRLAALMVLAAMLLAGAAAFAVYLFGHSGWSMAAPAHDRHAGDARYELDITPYYDEGALLVRQSVYFTNGDTALDRLVFSLPLNAYRRSTTAPLDADAYNAAFEQGYAPGGIEFTSLTLDGNEVEWGVSGTREALLTLLCDIAPGQSVRVDMEYHALLPEFSGAGGFDDAEWRMSGFCPLLGRVQDGTWTAYAPAYVGQYLYAPVSDFDITLHAISDYSVMTGGSAVVSEAEGGWNTWRIQLCDARSPAIVMRRGGHVYQRDVNGVSLRVYSRDRLQARRMLDEAASMLNALNELYEYPYPALDIVLGEYEGQDASEAGLILADTRAPDLSARVCYLMARQIWGGIADCDPVEEPWLSEALAQYSALRAAGRAGLNCCAAMRRDIDASLSITMPGGLNVESQASAFTSQNDYDNVLRYRGAAVLELLSEASEGALDEALPILAQEHAYDFITREELLNALSQVDGGDWSAWLAETLQGIGRAG